jgi:hypothetical protein
MPVTVLSLNNDQEQHELIYSSSFIMLNKNDFISVYLNEKLNNWVLHISFYDNNKQPPLSVDFNVREDSNLSINCNKWYADNWLENPEPFVVKSKDGKTNALIKIRSLANYTQNQRTLEVSIWKKIPKA